MNFNLLLKNKLTSHLKIKIQVKQEKKCYRKQNNNNKSTD